MWQRPTNTKPAIHSDAPSRPVDSDHVDGDMEGTPCAADTVDTNHMTHDKAFCTPSQPHIRRT